MGGIGGWEEDWRRMGSIFVRFSSDIRLMFVRFSFDLRGLDWIGMGG